MKVSEYFYVSVSSAVMAGTLLYFINGYLDRLKENSAVENNNKEQAYPMAETPVAETPVAETTPVAAETPVAETGGWVDLEANTVYQAESNGFIVTYSGGKGKVARGVIREGNSPSKNDLPWRTRFHDYDGAVLPVQKGRYWLVEALDGPSKSITVRWLASP